jgi:hypothetical protein
LQIYWHPLLQIRLQNTQTRFDSLEAGSFLLFKIRQLFKNCPISRHENVALRRQKHPLSILAIFIDYQ